MRTLDEVKKDSKKYKRSETVGPSKDVFYEKYIAAKPKVAGGTVNPIISTDAKVKENRNLGERKTTTYEETLAKNRRTAGKYNAAVPASAKAVKNIKELIFGTPKQGGTINPTISAADFSTRYDKMTAREKAVYSHYKQAGKNKEAADYLKAIEMDVNKRAATQRTADAKKLAEDSTMGGLYARYMGALTSPLATAYSLVQDARGEAIDPNNPLFMGEQIRQGQTEGFLGEDANKKFGEKGWGKKKLKQGALGVFDWGSQVATLGALGLSRSAMGAASSGLYGASAFSGNAKDATERGATTEEAVAYGTIGAAAEIITEKLGFERLFGLGKLAKVAGGKGRLAAEILKNMRSEGLEEGTSEAANQIADALIMGDRSRMAETYQAARAAGKTEGQATAAALWDAIKQIADSAAVGALSGGMIAGGVAGGSRLTGRNVLGEGTTEAEQPLTEEEQTLQTEQNMPSAEQTASVVEQEKPVAEQTMPITEQTAPVIEQTAPTAEEQPTAEVREMGQQTAERTVSPETQEAESYTKDLQEYSGKYYGAKGQEVYLRKAAETGNLDHTAAFNTYYRAGIAGITEDEIQPTAYTAAADKLMLNEAWMAGAEDRRAEIANAIRGTSKLTGKRGLIVGEDVKATEGQLAIAKLYADIGGAEIRLVDEISFEQDGKKHTANGYYEDGVITLALKSDSFMGTMNHEMIHYIRKANPAGYDAMRELVFKLANKSGIDMEKHMAEYEELYGDAYGEDVQMTDIMEEVVADGFQKIVENEADLKEFLDELSKKDKTLVERIQDFFKKMGETIKALFEDNTYAEFAEDLSKDLENIKQLRKKFAEVLADTGRMEEGEGRAEQTSEAKFSLTGKTEDGMEVYETSEDIKKMPYAERMKLFVSLMENEYRGRTAKFSKNGRVYYARFANEDVKKNIWGDKQSDKEGWKAKINVGAEGNIFELVENADYTGSKEEAGKRAKAHAGVLKWDYYVKRVQINGRVYDLLANVREKQDGEYVCSIGLKRNKKITPAPPLASADNRNNGMAALQDGVNTDVINQSVAQEAAENNNRNVTKKTDAELKSFGLQSPSGITEHGSETGIEDLLPKVKEKHNDVKFSIRKEDYDLLKEQNIQLKEANDALMQQFEITKEEKVDRASAKKAARRWLEKHDSKFDVEEFAERFSGLYEYAQKVQGQEDFGNVMCALQMLAEEALQESEALNTELWDEYAQMRKTIRNTTIKVTDEIKKELDYAGGYNQIRLGNFNLISLSTKKGIAADTFFQELAELYPEFFKQEEVNTQGEMIVKIVDVLDSIRPDIYNPYGYDLSGYAMDAAYELFDLFQEVQLQKPTFADKYERKLQKAREKYRDELMELRESAREKQKKALLRQRDKLSDQYESWKEKYKERNKRAWKKAKKKIAWDSYVRATDRLLEKEFNRKEKEKLRRQKKKWNTHRRQIEKDTQAMLKWLAKPTNKYHVPKRYIESLSVILTKLNTSNRGVTLL